MRGGKERVLCAESTDVFRQQAGGQLLVEELALQAAIGRGGEILPHQRAEGQVTPRIAGDERRFAPWTADGELQCRPHVARVELVAGCGERATLVIKAGVDRQ